VRGALLVSIVALAAFARAEERQSYRAESRVAYVERALEAVRAAPAHQLQRADEYMRAMMRNACASGIDRLRVECMVTASRRYCAEHNNDAARRIACGAYVDVLASRALAEEAAALFDGDDRTRDLRRAAAHLAIDFALSEGARAHGDASIATAIDRFCMDAASSTRTPAWQTCAATLIWTVAAHE